MIGKPVPIEFGQLARRAGIGATFGVPDSLMKGAIASLEKEFSPSGFTIAANEGSAIGMAIGYFLATRSLPLVFMQNSGLGNALNPLLSLADSTVYSIPLILLIGWRAELMESGEQEKDEAQHLKQGRVTPGQLELIGVRQFTLKPGGDIAAILNEAAKQAVRESAPVAVLVRAGAIATSMGKQEVPVPMGYATREEMVGAVVEATGRYGPLAGVPVVATTGMASRELYEERREQLPMNAAQDFLTIGGMGHAISIASAIAQELYPRKVLCLDGDGSVLMHMGALSNASQRSNLIHVILDNGVHDSVGGQPTGFRRIDVRLLSSSLGYRHYNRVESRQELAGVLNQISGESGSICIHALCEPGHRENLGRPRKPPRQRAAEFSAFLDPLSHSIWTSEVGWSDFR